MQKKKRSRVGVPRGAELRAGPPKTRRRAEEKRTNDYNERDVPAAHLLDLIRVMVFLDEPYEMSVFKAFLELRLNVVRSKNDFVEDRPAEESQYRHIICNILFAHGDVEHVVEVQLTTQEFAQLRKWSHRPYKVERAKKKEDIMGALIFQEALTSGVVGVVVAAHRWTRRHQHTDPLSDKRGLGAGAVSAGQPPRCSEPPPFSQYASSPQVIGRSSEEGDQMLRLIAASDSDLRDSSDSAPARCF